jgi:hypothetical protein
MFRPLTPRRHPGKLGRDRIAQHEMGDAMSTRANLGELIEDARQQLRRAEGRLTEDEQVKDAQRAEVEKLKGFMLRKLQITASIDLNLQVTWSDGHPVAILRAEDKTFHVRKLDSEEMYGLFIIEGSVEREIARIESVDDNFSARLIAAIGDAIGA